MVSSSDANRILNALERSINFAGEMRAEAMHLLSELDGYDWCGTYRLEGATLILDEFVGKPTEHTHIPIGRGVCGVAVTENKNQVVEDVRLLSHYLSCSMKTRSEIVVLVLNESAIVGQIDIDSHQVKAFDDSDEKFLEKMAAILSARWQ